MLSTLDNIIRQASVLSADEKLHLAAYLLEQARIDLTPSRPRRSWMELAGVAPYPLVGEDAQTWVSRARDEADAYREKNLGQSL
jgi:hypothetical protein